MDNQHQNEKKIMIFEAIFKAIHKTIFKNRFDFLKLLTGR
jgi:hypothetical protein